MTKHQFDLMLVDMLSKAGLVFVVVYAAFIALAQYAPRADRWAVFVLGGVVGGQLALKTARRTSALHRADVRKIREARTNETRL